MITLGIIVVTCLVSIIAFSNGELREKFIFDPYLIRTRKEWYRFFSHALLHGDWMHLFFNMFALYMFGTHLEETFFTVAFGDKAALFYILLYVGGTALSSIYSYEKHKHDHYYRALGASGAVSAVMFAFILFAPLTSLYLFFIPIPVPAFIFGGLYLWYSWYMSKRNTDNIGHDAHFWGAAFGIAFTILMVYSTRSEFPLIQNFINQVTGFLP